jgi:predicted phage terminase large subunit-like protein
MPHVVSTEIDAPPEKIALLAQLRAEARKRTDPHLAWLRCARPDQILPGGDWRILYYQGGRGCVAPETRIWLPDIRKHVPVKELAEQGKPVTVLALGADGPTPAKADAPFLKGVADLFTFTLEGGTHATVTGEHQFLTPDGWVYAGTLSVGDEIGRGRGWAPSPVWLPILSIEPQGAGPYYDLQVPDLNNYLAEGIWHHNSGKTRSGTQGLAQLIREDKGDPGDWGIIAPTYQSAWTTCVEGPSGILAALGTSMAEIKEHRSATVASAYRTYGEITLHSGHVIRVDSANDGALRVQGKNLKGAYCVAEGELITTWGGDVPVEQVHVGDMVATRSGWGTVTAAGLTRRNAAVVRLTAGDGRARRTLRCTADHRVWAAGRGWVSAALLTADDSVTGIAPRRDYAVLSVEPDGTADVYDLSVAGEPEFFAGGILIHNCSEIGLWLKWATAWDESIAYAVRLGESKIIACGTPKISRPAAKLIRRLLSGEPGVIVRRLRTVDNLANLSGAFYEAIVARASGTRLERQELEGELLDDVENALWTRDLLHAIQVDEIPGADAEHTGLHTVYVGVDPSDGGEESDEQAFAVVGQGEDYKLYVAESWGGRIGPVPFLKKAVLAAAQWHGTLVVEKNHGGAFLIETLRQVMRDLGVYVPYMVVHASLGKRTRAEPVAAMYERGVVRHVNGPHVDLEDQMATFTGAARERSPDRLDALTWACTPFLGYDLGYPDPYKLGAKRWAQSRELDAMAGSQTLFRRRVIAGNYGENTTRQPGAWDLDTFAPQDDVGQGNRPNVKSWS